MQSQMVFDLARLEAFLSAAEDTLVGVRFYASVALLRSERMAERARALPGVAIPSGPWRIRRGGGIDLAGELAAGLASISRVDALRRIRSARRRLPARSPRSSALRGASAPSGRQRPLRNRNPREATSWR